jgi:NDP-sugar pyrophosphorylase family protein
MTPTPAIRSGAILAAGEGSRLKRDGWTLPKPLVPVRGVPLIEHVLSNFSAAGVTSVALIFNEREEECARFVRERFPELDFEIVIRTTASSLESFRTIAPLLPPGPALVSTVDAWCPRRDFLAFVGAAARAGEGETVLAVTPFVADERPLWASLDASGRVTRLGGSSGDAVTAGMYVFAERVRALSPPPDLARLRELLAWLVEIGEPVRAISIPKVVDVDRGTDVAAASAMAQEPAEPARRM